MREEREQRELQRKHELEQQNKERLELEKQLQAERLEHAEDRKLIKDLLAREIPALTAVPGAEDQQFINLKDQMDTFVYDPEKNLTFEVWYDRFESVFTHQAGKWDDAKKVQLLTRMLTLEDFSKLDGKLSPKKPREVPFDEIIKVLKNKTTPSYALNNKSPAQLMLNRSLKTRLDLLKPGETSTNQRNIAMEERFNFAHGARWKEFSIGDRVWYKLHNIHKNAWDWTPATVVERVGSVNYNIQLENGRLVSKAHTNQLKMRFNEIKDAFELAEVPDDVSAAEVEPIIFPEAIDHQQQQPNIANGLRDNMEQQRDDVDQQSGDNQAAERSINDSDVFEDAEDDGADDQDFGQQQVPELRRTTRANAGVPPQRYRD